MKTKFFGIAVLAAALALSCDPQEEEKVISFKLDDSLKEIEFAKEESSKTVPFTANCTWTVNVPASASSWLSVSPASGESATGFDEKFEPVFTVTENTGNQDRTAECTIICDETQTMATIKVTQHFAYFLNASVDQDFALAVGAKFNFTVETNGTWDYSLDADGATWLTESSSSANALVLEAKDGSASTAQVTIFLAEDPTISTTIPLEKKMAKLTIDGQSIDFCGAAATATVEVAAANVSNWTATAPSWAKAERVDNTHLAITVQANTGTAERSGEVVITDAAYNDVTASIAIKQGIGAPAPDLFDAVFSADGSVKDVAGNHTVAYYPGATCTMVQNTKLNLYYPSFTHSYAGTAAEAGYYRCDIDASMSAAILDGFTVEVLISTDFDPAGNKNEAKAFGSTKAGGFCIINCSKSSSRNNNLAFLVHDGEFKYNLTGMVMEVGKVYHVVGTWEKAGEEGVSKVYVDGKLVNTLTTGPDITMGTLDPNYLVIGGNQDTQNSIKSCWTGGVQVARLYGSVLSEAQVAGRAAELGYGELYTINK